MRLVLRVLQSGSKISQQIIANVEKHQSSTHECISAISGFVTVSHNFLTVVGNMKNILSCIPDSENMKVNATAVFNGLNLEFNNNLISISNYLGIPFDFKTQTQEKVLDLVELPDTMIYITFFEEEIIREEAMLFKSIGSCFSRFKALVSNKQTCLVIFPIYNQRCVNLYQNGVVTKFQQILQFNSSSSSRITYQVFEFILFVNDHKYDTICFNEKEFIKDSAYQFYNGSYKIRQKQYLNDIKKAFQPFTAFTNNLAYQYEYYSGIDENVSIYLSTGITIALIFIIVMIVFYVIVIKLLQ